MEATYHKNLHSVTGFSGEGVDPSVAASASITASQSHTTPDLIFPETQPCQSVFTTLPLTLLLEQSVVVH
jgi:hypothetical protein